MTRACCDTSKLAFFLFFFPGFTDAAALFFFPASHVFFFFSPSPNPLHSWLGAEERHLDKYAAWWRSKGWETRLIAFDASTTMSFASAERAFDQHLADLAARLADRARLGASPRLAFHAFSNTGWIMYARFVELLAPLGIRAAGAVIDSAPHTAICTKVWAAGFVSATSPKLPPAAAAKTLRYRAARALFKVVWAGERKARFDSLVKAEARVASFPQLYIYSATVRREVF